MNPEKCQIWTWWFAGCMFIVEKTRGQSERTCGAPMFGFGNWWQSLRTNGCLELYLKVLSIGFSWNTCVGFKESLCRPRCYSRNYLKIGLVRGRSRLSQIVNQVDQHTKRRRCTERDQAIPWYGKHCQLRFCVLTHDLRGSSLWD